jgi:ABC-2 type transport system permease protein
MSWTRIFAIVLRQYYLTRDNPTRTLQIFLWPFLDIVLWGFISKYLNEVSPGGDLIPVLLGAIILWDFLSRVMTGVTMTFFEDVWSRNFLNMFASPLSIREYVSGMVVSTVGTSTIGFIGMLIAGGFLFGFTITSYGFLSLPFLLVLFLSGVALGIFGVALVLRFGPSAEWFIWPLPAIVAPFVGVFYPIETLPHWMQLIGKVLPPTYVFEGVRAVVAGRGIESGTLIVGSILGIFYIALSYAFFVRVYRRAVRTGLIARYSAETVA